MKIYSLLVRHLNKFWQENVLRDRDTFFVSQEQVGEKIYGFLRLTQTLLVANAHIDLEIKHKHFPANTNNTQDIIYKLYRCVYQLSEFMFHTLI